MQTIEFNKTSAQVQAKPQKEQTFFAPSIHTRQEGDGKVVSGGNNSGNSSFFPARPQPVIQPKLTINKPIIQKVANFAAGAIHAVNNVATQIATGGPAGNTPIMLNGNILLSVADAQAAIVSPVLNGRTNATTSQEESQVQSVGTNTGSFDETVLTAGPWTTVTPRANVAARLELPACAVAGDSNLTANGRDTDQEVAKANRKHEDRHAAGYKTAFNRTILPWDAALTKAQRAGTVFTGPDRATAEANLFTAMGGTPGEIARDYLNDCVALNVAFHASPTGGELHAFDPDSNADCSTSWVSVRQ